MSGGIESRALTVKDVCARYAIGRTTAFAEIKAGRLLTVKLGRSTRIDMRDAEAWWTSMREASAAAHDLESAGEIARRIDVYTLGGIVRYARAVIGGARVDKIIAEARREVRA